MRSLFNLILAISILFSFSSAQTMSAAPADKATVPAPNLPSEATVDSFLQQTFGYEKDLTWKISSIKPGPVAGLAEVSVVLATPQGQQMTRLYITPDGEHAMVGDIIPFGPKPGVTLRASSRSTPIPASTRRRSSRGSRRSKDRKTPSPPCARNSTGGAKRSRRASIGCPA